MVNKYVGAGQAVIGAGKKVIQKLSGQGKTTGKEGIRSFKPGKNLTTKRNIQDKITKAVDEGTKKGMKAAGAKPEFLTPDQKTKLRQSMSKQKRDKSKELKDYSYKSEEFFKRRQKNKKETKNLLKGAMGLTATTGVLQGVNIKLKRDEKKRKAKAKKQDEARVKKMGGGMMGRRMGYSQGSNNGKPVSRSKNPGLLKMSKSEKGKAVVKKFGYNPNRIVAKKGGKA
tara:strand:- start:53 stop:733 length:681 start_codon:yes stop_codon:yes gene_type:complete